MGRWARDWGCCRECGTTDIPHAGGGLCRRCYNRQYSSPTVVCKDCGEEKPHAGHGLCRACYERMRRRGKNHCIDCGAEISPTATYCHSCAHKIDGWARDWECCRECGTTDIPHAGGGLCRRCYTRKYTEDQKKYIDDYQHKWYLKHQEGAIKAATQWQQEHPYRCAGIRHAHRARRVGADIEAGVDILSIYELYDYTCIYCGRTEDLTIDHIVPLKNGGVHCNDNMVVACRSCNSSKSNKPLGEWLLSRPDLRAWVA